MEPQTGSGRGTGAAEKEEISEMEIKMENTKSGVVLPQQIVEKNMEAAAGKANMPLGRMILLGIFAGMFIAGGAAASSVAMHAVTNVGIARLLGGCIFPVGLMMIVFIGGELFTGDCLMIMGCVHKKFSVLKMLRVLVVVYVTNLLGAVVIAFLAYASGQFGYTGGLLGAFTIKVAMGKVNLSFGAAFCSGILCNIFVCAAVLMATAATDIAGKVWAIFFPIMAFVVSGYEHCVANMYYIPAGIFAMNNSAYAEKAMTEYGYTAEQLADLSWGSFFVKSAIPVTLGNMVGGMVFVGLILYFVHAKNLKKQ